MAQCLTPFYLQHGADGDYIPFPCGKCPPCMARRISGWSFRLMQEYKVCDSAMFLTLTYDTDSVPISKKGFMTLQKTDLQKYMKRLRKINTHMPNKLKYYAVGEYGEKFMRPHYHYILFNADITTIQRAWSLDNKYIGDVHYGDVNEASVGYCLKYMSKIRKIPMHQNDDRMPEFSLMSKGLGANYLTDDMVIWHKSDLLNRMYCNIVGGKKIVMPRYYKNKIYDENERDLIAQESGKKSRLLQDEYVEDMTRRYGDQWMAVKAENDKYAFEKMYKKALEGRYV